MRTVHFIVAAIQISFKVLGVEYMNLGSISCNESHMFWFQIINPEFHLKRAKKLEILDAYM